MIEINLLPEELKVKKETTTKFSSILFTSTIILLTILVIINIYIISLTTVKNIQFKALNKKWQDLEPQRQRLEKFKKESDVLSEDARAIQQLIGHRIVWASKINRLSLLLPSGVWFNEISSNNKNFILKGSVISLKKEEMSLINSLLTNLKEDKLFFSDFQTIDLTSVQRRLMGGYEVVDFIFTGSFKSK